MRPRLAASEVAQSMMDHLLNADVMLPPTPRVFAPAVWVINRTLRAATIATMPQWMRKMAGLRQSRLVDALITPVMRLSFRVAHLSSRVELELLAILSPATRPVVAPILLGIPPRNPETLTPAEARERYGYDKPRDAHQEWRAQQRRRVFEEGVEPSDSGLVESEPVLGALA